MIPTGNGVGATCKFLDKIAMAMLVLAFMRLVESYVYGLWSQVMLIGLLYAAQLCEQLHLFTEVGGCMIYRLSLCE